MRNRFLLNQKNEAKLSLYERFIYCMFVFLLSGSIILIAIGVYSDGSSQIVLLSLGTGVATSFIVSTTFYVTAILTKKKDQIKNRDKFVFELKELLYNAVENINFSPIQSGTYIFQDYIKAQHRWFHDYYKRMVAKSESASETKKRLSDIKEFLDSNCFQAETVFGFSTIWKQSQFNEYQLHDIEYIFLLFKSVENAVATNKTRNAILDFSSLLQGFIRIIDDVEELKSFKLIRIVFEDGKATFCYEDFERNEPMFKFLREFSEIRRKNYIKTYGTKTNLD